MMTHLLRPAGLRADSFGETAALALTFEAPKESRSPVRNPTVPDITFGRQTQKSESVGKCFDAMKKCGISKLLSDKAEHVYKSNKIEPLGKGRTRGHSLPPPGHTFGKPPQTRDCSTAEVIFPSNPAGTLETPTVYKRTHHSFDPGEQVRRSYVFPSEVQRSDFLFGRREAACTTPVQEALRWNTDGDCSSPLLPRFSDFHQASHDKLGQPRNLLQGPKPVPASHRFGMQYRGTDDTAHDCIHSNFSDSKHLLPDADLGKPRCRVRVS
jgi:hypothetical protein